MTEHEDNRVHYLVDACEVRGHLDIKPDDLSLILIHQRELGKEDALAGLAKHDKEVKNKTIEEILQVIRNGMSELLESPWANYMGSCFVKAVFGAIDDLILKKDIEQMKEGGISE